MLLAHTHATATTRATADEVRALVSFLSSSMAAFRPPHMSSAVLRKLVLRCSVISVSAEEVKLNLLQPQTHPI